MPKTKISEFDTDPSNNTDINSINIAEGCAPSGINNAIRQLMSDLKEFQTGGSGDSFNGAVNGAVNGTLGATTPSTAVVTTLTANTSVSTDLINEKTSATGVTIDGVLIKDNAVTASGGFSGAINGTVGAITANTGAFTTLSASGVATLSAGSISAPAITTTGDTNTGIFFPSADTIAFTEGGTKCGEFDSSANFKFNSGYGSAAIAYGCRAWVNFDGVAITVRAHGNVASVSDNGVGDYTINFITAMPDANYSFVGGLRNDPATGSGTNAQVTGATSTAQAAGSLRITTGTPTLGTLSDYSTICVAIFR